MPWSTSTRRARLPRDWRQRVAAVKARAGGRCEADTHVAGCNGIGAQCDHRTAGDDHSLSNLQWLSVACHTAKTQQEAAAARSEASAVRRQARRLPSEAHPGRISPGA